MFHVAKEERQSLLPGDKLRSRRGTFILWRDVDLVDGALTAEAMGWMVAVERKCLPWLLDNIYSVYHYSLLHTFNITSVYNSFSSKISSS